MPAPPAFLRTIGLFASLSDDEVEHLAGVLKESTYAEGTVILTEGQGGISFFLVGDGTVEYSIDGERVGSGGVGEYFGEVALIDDKPRAATVTAATDVTVYATTFWEFDALLEAHPDVASKLRAVMSERRGTDT